MFGRLRKWQAMQLTATAAVVALGMLVTSTFSFVMRQSRPGMNPFDLATLALAGFAIWLLVKPLRKPKPKWSPPPDLWQG